MTTSPDKHIPAGKLIDLSGRGAIVTGGAAGIGQAISCRLAEAGASVFIADADGEGAFQASQELRSHGYRASAGQCDVSQEEEARNMVRAAVKETGRIDILVNNAGIYPHLPLAQMTGDDFDRVISVNLKGTFLCSREVSQQMIAQGQGGGIISIASIDAGRCDGCGECVTACPAGIFEVVAEDGRPPKARVKEAARKKLALLCPGFFTCRRNLELNCQGVCPQDAISHTW